MHIKPVLTEKSLSDAKLGKYTFYVDKSLDKYQIRKLVNSVFSVNVTSVHVISLKKEVKKSFSGKLKVKPARKKAIVTLKDKEKIDLFETKK